MIPFHIFVYLFSDFGHPPVRGGGCTLAILSYFRDRILYTSWLVPTQLDRIRSRRRKSLYQIQVSFPPYILNFLFSSLGTRAFEMCLSPLQTWAAYLLMSWRRGQHRSVSQTDPDSHTGPRSKHSSLVVSDFPRRAQLALPVSARTVLYIILCDIYVGPMGHRRHWTTKKNAHS